MQDRNWWRTRSMSETTHAPPHRGAAPAPAPAARQERRRIGFRTQMILFVGTLVVLMLAIQGAYLNQRYAQVMEEQIGLRALAVAKTVAEIPGLIAAFDTPAPASIIQPIAEAVRVQTGATFVVVGNR
ncbi:hypothetical protein RZS08_46210, partial [Arthrospira platensis SPKY1]|nr:hypothetical protein [Arthrospira platensis SPKY1]